jgi:hypothetical protein
MILLFGMLPSFEPGFKAARLVRLHPQAIANMILSLNFIK